MPKRIQPPSGRGNTAAWRLFFGIHYSGSARDENTAGDLFFRLGGSLYGFLTEIILGAEQYLAPLIHLGIAAVRLEDVGLGVVGQLNLKDMHSLFFQSFITRSGRGSPPAYPGFWASSQRFPYRFPLPHCCGNRKSGCAPESFLRWSGHGYSR